MGQRGCWGQGRLPSTTPAPSASVAEKVTGSQDDGFVAGLNTSGWRCRKDEKIEKVTGSQGDDFVGV